MLIDMTGIERDDAAPRHVTLPRTFEHKGRPFRVAQITDLHVVCNQPILTSRDDLIRCLEELIDESQPDLIVASGDLTQDGKREEFEELRAAFEAVETPILPFYGGHDGRDLRPALPTEQGWVSRFEELLGPAYYSSDWGGVHFVLYANEDSSFSEGAARAKWQWLKQDLARQPPACPVVAFLHTPPRDELLDLLCAHRVRGILFGHWHSLKSFHYNGTYIASAPPLCFGGIDTSPRGWRMIEYAEPTEIRTELHAAGARNLEPAAPDTLALGPGRYRQAWCRVVPGGVHRAVPSLSNGALLAIPPAEDIGETPGIRCLDAMSGETRWTAETDASVKNRVALDDRARCAAVTVTGRLYLVDAESGGVRWISDLPEYPHRWIFAGAAVSREHVYAGGRAGYGAFDIETGEPTWYRELGTADNWSCFASPVIAGNRLIAHVQRRGLVALNRTDGEIAWECELALEYYSAAPIVTGGDHVIAAGGGNWIAMVRAATGDIVWRRELEEDTYATTLTASGTHLYVTTSHGHVECRDMESGKLRWRARTGRDLLDMVPYKRGRHSVHAPPIVLNGTLCVAANDGRLHSYDLQDGRPTADINFGTPLTAVLPTAPDSFCITTLNGTLCRYTLES